VESRSARFSPDLPRKLVDVTINKIVYVCGYLYGTRFLNKNLGGNAYL